MQKSRLYILQLMGIVMLIAGYFISDIPDSRSAMHFDLSNTHVIRAAHQERQDGSQIVSVSSHERSTHKGRSVKHFSFKVVIPRQTIVYHYVPLQSVTYATPLSEHYGYLFSKEINPPPPKSC